MWFFEELWQFASGHAFDLAKFQGGAFAAMKEIALFSSSLALAMLVVSLIVLCIMYPFQRPKEVHEHRLTRIPIFSIAVMAPLVEEFLFRIVPLVILVSLFPGVLAFSVLLFSFNAAWAVMHRWRWKTFWIFPLQAKGVVRPRWMIALIFSDGMVFGYTLFKYGAFTSILAHAAYNSTILALPVAIWALVTLVVVLFRLLRSFLRLAAK